MRDFLAHHYFATRPDIIQLPIDKRLPSLAAAVARLQDEAREHENVMDMPRRAASDAHVDDRPGLVGAVAHQDVAPRRGQRVPVPTRLT